MSDTSSRTGPQALNARWPLITFCGQTDDDLICTIMRNDGSQVTVAIPIDPDDEFKGEIMAESSQKNPVFLNFVTDEHYI